MLFWINWEILFGIDCVRDVIRKDFQGRRGSILVEGSIGKFRIVTLNENHEFWFNFTSNCS